MLDSNQKNELVKIELLLENIILQIDNFNNRFSEDGWCVYDNMNYELIERCNLEFEKNGKESAENLLIEYYKTDVKCFTNWIKNSSKAFSDRHEILEVFFNNHFNNKYYESIPLGLIIVDGAVNDYTKSKGFFAEGTDVSAWDCLVGCSEALTKLQKIFNSKRTKTNFDAIKNPYRNGILHGRDLNYANEFVSCKLLALIFAVANWMEKKDSEEKRKLDYNTSLYTPSIMEFIKQSNDIKKFDSEKKLWKKRTICIGKDIPKCGKVEDYKDYPYVEVIINMLNSWKEENYGKLSGYFKKIFNESLSESNRAGKCRKLFKNKKLESFELIEVEERACSLSKVVVKAIWKENNILKDSLLELGCLYKEFEGQKEIALPWKNNGEWVIIPWNINGLYT